MSVRLSVIVAALALAGVTPEEARSAPVKTNGFVPEGYVDIDSFIKERLKDQDASLRSAGFDGLKKSYPLRDWSKPYTIRYRRPIRAGIQSPIVGNTQVISRSYGLEKVDFIPHCLPEDEHRKITLKREDTLETTMENGHSVTKTVTKQIHVSLSYSAPQATGGWGGNTDASLTDQVTTETTSRETERRLLLRSEVDEFNELWPKNSIMIISEQPMTDHIAVPFKATEVLDADLYVDGGRKFASWAHWITDEKERSVPISGTSNYNVDSLIIKRYPIRYSTKAECDGARPPTPKVAD